MKRNPLIPFASYCSIRYYRYVCIFISGLNKSKELAGCKKWRETSTNSIQARGYCEAKLYELPRDQLQGAVGPNLQKIGGKLSKDEIKEILSKGKGNMPPNIVPADQAAKVADWLSKKNKVQMTSLLLEQRLVFLYFLKIR